VKRAIRPETATLPTTPPRLKQHRSKDRDPEWNTGPSKEQRQVTRKAKHQQQLKHKVNDRNIVPGANPFLNSSGTPCLFPSGLSA